MSFRVIAPADDRSLISIEDAREAAGIVDDSQDTKLGALVLAISDLLSRECGVVASGSLPPSLRIEICEETYRHPRSCSLRLSRRFVAVTSIAEDGIVLTAEDFDTDGNAGILTRLVGDRERCWGRRVVVTYSAGFEEVPADLKRAAITALQEFRSADSRDPLLRSETVEGVGRMDFQVGGSGRDSGNVLPSNVVAALDPYVTMSIG